MNRTLMMTALLALVALTGCGNTDKTENAGNSGSGGASFDKASTLDAAQQAQLAVKIDLKKMMAMPMIAEAIETGDEDFKKYGAKAEVLDIQVNFPAEFDGNFDTINFAASVTFPDAESAKAAFDELSTKGPSTDENIGGVDYKVVSEGGGPTMYATVKDSAMVFLSKAYAESGADSFASDKLRSIMKDLGDDMMLVGFDMKGASEFLKGAAAMAPPNPMTDGILEAFLKAETMTMTGGVGDTLFMMSMESPDEDSNKNLHQQLSKILAMAMGGMAMFSPDEKKAPATSEMFNHILTSLSPKKEGSATMIKIEKPENFDDLTNKMGEEIKSGAAIPPGMMGLMGGGMAPAGPGLNGPIR